MLRWSEVIKELEPLETRKHIENPHFLTNLTTKLFKTCYYLPKRLNTFVYLLKKIHLRHFQLICTQRVCKPQLEHFQFGNKTKLQEYCFRVFNWFAKYSPFLLKTSFQRDYELAVHLVSPKSFNYFIELQTYQF